MDPVRAQQAFEFQRNGDRFGLRVHLILGVICVLMLCGPTSAAEWAILPIGASTLIRAWFIWRIWRWSFCQPVMVLALAWLAFGLLSLLWSPDPEQGQRELARARWLILVFALWPLMEYRIWLIGAMLGGFFLAGLVQLDQAAGWTLLDWARSQDRDPDRMSGFWSPVVGGSLLCGALGLHLAALVCGRGLWKWLGAGGAALAVFGIIATGSRGAWLAGAMLLVVVGAWAMLRGGGRARGERWRTGGAIAALACIGLLVAWWLAGDAVERRLERGVDEVRAALVDRSHDSDTGARVLMWRTAGRVWLSHPIHGVGMGGYQTAAQDRLAEVDPDARPGLIHAHAHGSVPHVAATMGLIGLVLGGLMVGAALWSGWRAAGDAGRAGFAQAYRLAPMLGLAGLMLSGLTHTVQVGAQTAAHLVLFMVLCLGWAPATRSAVHDLFRRKKVRLQREAAGEGA